MKMTGSVCLSVVVLVIGCVGQGLFSKVGKRAVEESKNKSMLLYTYTYQILIHCLYHLYFMLNLYHYYLCILPTELRF